MFSFPPALDNTMVSGFRACPRKFWWRHQRMLQRGETSIHLISGGAFAKGLEVTRKYYFDLGLPFEEAFLFGAAALIGAYGFTEPHPKYGAKNVWNLIGAMEYYFKIWPIDKIIIPNRRSDGKHEIEYNFVLPIPNTTHPNNGGPILYCGRFDMVGKHENGLILGEDDKTTTQLGESWFNRWRLSNQLIGYTWGAQEHGFPLAGFNIRGVSLLKHSYGSADAGPILIGKARINRFVENLQLTVERMVRAYETDKWEYDFGGSCSAYGGCDYLSLCEAHDPEDWIEPNFVINEWNPLASRD